MSKSELIAYLKRLNPSKQGNYFYYFHKRGNYPTLTAHIDTVFDEDRDKPEIIERGSILTSPDGLGADDRAGVFILLYLMQQGYPANYLFTDCEETGGHGAREVTVTLDLSPTPYFIAVDRKGYREAAHYKTLTKEMKRALIDL
ncbi:MAG: hypothetical protein ACK42D_04815, partial [Candidatus Paceibacteria bacterium]